MSSKQIVKSVDNQELFWQGVSSLRSTYKFCHFLFSRGQFEYRRQRLVDEKSSFKDISFVLFDSGVPYYAFLGFKIINKREESIDVKINSGELPSSSLEASIITTNQKKSIAKALEVICSEIDGIEYIELMQRSTISTTSDYFLQKPNCQFRQKFHCMIDLAKTEQDLKKEIRKSFKSLINWGQSNLEFMLINHDNLSDQAYEEFMKFRELHFVCAGKRTRSRETWDIQYKCIEEGTIFAILGYWNGQMVTGGLFNISDNYVYYANSASARDLFDKPMFHSVMWKAIRYSKDIGASLFDVGEINFNCQSRLLQISDKELGISKFKSGFGGQIKPILEINVYKNSSIYRNKGA